MAESHGGEARSNASPMDTDAEDICWICLDDGSQDSAQTLMSPCKCPRKVHPKCLARWQLQQAGKAEETQCRFCNSTLADWKHSLTPAALKPDVQKVQPIMVVYFEGEIHRIPVKQGGDGLKEFTTRIRELFRLPEDVDISLTFGCKEPMSGQHLKLEGIGAFDAAVHCASVAAAERQHKIRSGGGAASGGGSGSSGASANNSAGGAAPPADGQGPPAAATDAAAAGGVPAQQPEVAAAPEPVARPAPLMAAARPHQSHSHGGAGHHSTPRNPAAGAPMMPFMPAPSSGGGAHTVNMLPPVRRVPPAAAMLQTVESGNVMMPMAPSVAGFPLSFSSHGHSGQQSGGASIPAPAALLSQQLPAVLREQESEPAGLRQMLAQELSRAARSIAAASASQGESRSSSVVTFGNLAGGCDPALESPGDSPPIHHRSTPVLSGGGHQVLPQPHLRSQTLPNPYAQHGHSAAYSAAYGTAQQQQQQPMMPAPREHRGRSAVSMPAPTVSPACSRDLVNGSNSGVGAVTTLPPLRTDAGWASRTRQDGPAALLPHSHTPGDGSCTNPTDGGIRHLAYTYGPSSVSGASSGPYAPSTPTLSPSNSAGVSPTGSAGGAPPLPARPVPATAATPNVTAIISSPFMPQPPASVMPGDLLIPAAPGTRRVRRSGSRDAAIMLARAASSSPSSPSSVSVGGASDAQCTGVCSDSSDSAGSVGSLTGRLKCSLKAFSKKVARSLHFSNQQAHTGPTDSVSAGGAPVLGNNIAPRRVTAHI